MTTHRTDLTLSAQVAAESAAAVAEDLAQLHAWPPPAQPSTDRSPASPLWRDQALGEGAVGTAILHGIRAQLGLDRWDQAHAWFTRATREALSAGPGAGLWFGAPAVAFALNVGAPPQRYGGTRATLDRTVERLIRSRLDQARARLAAEAFPPRAEYDIVHGLAGLGAYLLHRHAGGDLLRDVLSYLVRLTEPLHGQCQGRSVWPGWWTRDVPRRDGRAYPDGHADLGMAHGISGPLALLALALRRGITVDGHVAAIERICRWLDTYRQDAPSGAWWPERIGMAGLTDSAPAQERPGRPSWCYGVPGIARAQQLAGLALGDRVCQKAAEDALARSLDQAQLAKLTDPAVCHGWAGTVITAWHASRDASSPLLAASLPRTLASFAERAHAASSPGLIDGAAGVALTLHTAATGTSGGWETCLLIA